MNKDGISLDLPVLFCCALRHGHALASACLPYTGISLSLWNFSRWMSWYGLSLYRR